MSRTISHRSVTPFIKLLRTLLRGRSLVADPLRFTDQLAARTQPQPNLPGGPYNKTTDIYYFNRDARREIKPPINVVLSDQLLEGKQGEIKYITPGEVNQPT